jgi:hypothetical protein
VAEENRLRLNVLESREGCKRLLARLVEPSGSDLRATSSGQDVVLEEYVAGEEERARLEVESDAPWAVPRCVITRGRPGTSRTSPSSYVSTSWM